MASSGASSARSGAAIVLFACGSILIQTLILMFANWVLPGFVVRNWQSALGGAIAISAINLLVWPLFISLVRYLSFAIYIGLSLLLNGASVLVAGWVLPGVHVNDLWTASLVLLLLALGTTLFSAIFTFGGADYYTQYVIGRAVGGKAVARTEVPGFLFLQIDGPVGRHPAALAGSRSRAHHCPLAGPGQPSAHRLGSRPAVPDVRQPGWHLAREQ